MKVGRQTAGGLGLGSVALCAIPIEAIVEEIVHASCGRRRSTAGGHNINRMINGQAGQSVAIARQQPGGHRRPRASGVCREGRREWQRLCQRIFERHVGHVDEELLLQKSAK